MIKKVMRTLYYDVPLKAFRGRVFPCRNLIIELTYRCNLACKMCSIMNEIEAKENRRRGPELNQEEIIDVVDQLAFQSNVTFTGGEIFLKNGIEEIIRKTAAKHTVTLATNGLLLSKHAELILETGVKAIGVSLDGPPDLHNQIRNVRNAFEQLENSLHTIIEYKKKHKSSYPRITVNSVILSDNHSRLHEVVEIVNGFGLKSCSFQILDMSLFRSGIAPNGNLNFNQNPLKNVKNIDPVQLKKSLTKIIREGEKHGVATRFSPQLTIDEIIEYYQGKFNLKNWKCSMPWDTMRISPYGDVYPCMNLLVGNVRQNKLNELWNHPTYLQFRQNLKKVTLYPACVGCCKKIRNETQ